MKTSLFAGAALAALLFGTNAFAASHNLKATLAGSGSGTGGAALTYDDTAKMLCGTITYSGLSGPLKLAHIHDQAGNISVTLTPATSPMPVMVNDITADQGTVILSGTGYINMHTDANPGGEIQGNIVDDPAGTDQCAAMMDGGTGTDGGSTSSSSSSSSGSTSSSSSGSSSSGGSSSGATTTRPDAGSTSSGSSDSGGCSIASPNALGNGAAIAFGVGLALAGLTRSRRKR